MRMSWLAVVVMIIGGVSGCEDTPAEPPKPEPAPAPATSPATVAGAAAAAEPAMLESGSVTVADEPYLLPPMVLRFRAGAGRAIGLDEARSELLLSGHEKAEPTGNTLVLSMMSDAQQPADLPSVPWTYQSPSDEWTDTPQGITLRDERYVLRPYDVTVRFVPAGDTIAITLAGTFLRFDTLANPELPGVLTPVEAELEAALVVD